jgi:DNA topoisomerase-2
LIKRYATIGDIMEDYYQVRLKGYETRKDLEIKRLERELVEYDAKARFLLALLEDRMDLRRKSDDQIVTALKAQELPALDGMDKPDDIDSYEYLLKMRMDRVKASAVEDARNHVESARVALELLRATSAETMWIHDLDVFEKSWVALQETREAARTGAPLRKEVKKTIKLKKSTD